MANIREKAHQDRNLVERILHFVPGFRGYLGKEERRETDKLLREQLATRLDRIRRRLDPVMRDLTDSGGLMAVGDVDRLKKAIGRVADKIRHASYGYSGWFDVVKVREAELDRLYEFDIALLERIDVLDDLVNELAGGTHRRDGIKPLVDRGLSVTREFDEHLDRREQIISGIESEQDGGR